MSSSVNQIEHPESLSIGQVVGHNIGRLRRERQLTQEELLLLWSSVGLDWPRPKLSALESGARSTVSMSDAVLMATAMDLPFSELFRSSRPLRLDDKRRPIPADLFTQWLTGVAPTTEVAAALGERPLEAGSTRPTTPEAEMAARLDVPLKEVEYAALNRFGVSLTEQRDRLVQARSPKTLAERTALRGHVTRQLEEQIVQDLRRKGVLRE